MTFPPKTLVLTGQSHDSFDFCFYSVSDLSGSIADPDLDPTCKLNADENTN